MEFYVSRIHSPIIYKTKRGRILRLAQVFLPLCYGSVIHFRPTAAAVTRRGRAGLSSQNLGDQAFGGEQQTGDRRRIPAARCG